MLKYLLKIIKSLGNFLIKIANKKLNKQLGYKVEIKKVYKDTDDRCKIFLISNNCLGDIRKTVQEIFIAVNRDKRFTNFGSKKVVILSGIINGNEFNIHHNILIDSKTTWDEYYNNIKDDLYKQIGKGYPLDTLTLFNLRVWDVDNVFNSNIRPSRNIIKGSLNFHQEGLDNLDKYSEGRILPFPYAPCRYIPINILRRGYHTTVSPGFICDPTPTGLIKYYDRFNKDITKSSQFITPLKLTKKKDLNGFATLDIETMLDDTGYQIPILITVCINSKVEKFLIDLSKLQYNKEEAITDMFSNFLQFINKTDVKTVFVHNLGSFDGFFIFKYCLNFVENPNNVKSLINEDKEFISITLRTESGVITFKDSFRIFPVSLNKLCDVFKVEGKISKYNIEFNNLGLFNNKELLNEFLTYSVQDSLCLYNALKEAQIQYYEDFAIDIAGNGVLSTSSLSLKIFRTHFLNIDIPILTNIEDGFCRKGYYGGSTDIYKAYIKEGYYYDVNSLYPYAMLNDMPVKISYFINDMSDFKLEDFFGFCEARITTPDNIIRPILPFKIDGRTIHPKGSWTGVYFSEELKAVVKHGYKIELISGYAFTKDKLFKDYVKHFYDIKKNSEGAQRFIAKMHLNQIYGVFGRKLDLLETINIHKNDLPWYLVNRVVSEVITITPEIRTVLLKNNINISILDEINYDFKLTLNSPQYTVKSNVAIAAAVTSYARIHMMQFKISDHIFYTDTDSIFTSEKLSNLQVGKEIGKMKDELNGKIIKEALFLDIKKYGYYIETDEGFIENKSVISGIERDSVTFEEFKELFKGKTLVINVNERFIKTFKTLQIKVITINITLSFTTFKELIDNVYQPVTVHNGYIKNFIVTFLLLN